MIHRTLDGIDNDTIVSNGWVRCLLCTVPDTVAELHAVNWEQFTDILSYAKSDNYSDPLDTLISFRFSTTILTTSAYNNIGVIGIVSEQLQGKL